MAFSSTSLARKARRKEAREQKKQQKRAKKASPSKAVGAAAGAKNDSDPKEESTSLPKRKAHDVVAGDNTTTSSANASASSRSPGKKARRSVETPRDPYAHLDPDIAAAMRRDDEEIAELERKLGLNNSSDRGRKGLSCEYAKNEGFGEDFGAFLDSIDDMIDRVTGGGTHKGANSDDDSFDSDDSSESGTPRVERKYSE